MNLIKNENNIDKDYTRSPEYYQKLLENTVECLWVYNLNTQKFNYISPSIYSLRGLAVEEAMKESLEDSLTPESLQKIKNSGFKRFSRFLSGDRSEEVVCEIDEYEQYCKDGSIIIVEISTRLVFNETNQTIDVIGVSRDITKRKQYEQKILEQLREKTETITKLSCSTSDKLSYPRIYLFGKFQVFGPNAITPLKWRTEKTEELFAFLLHKKDSVVSKTELCDTLWPETDIEKVSTYLHTSLYNLKKSLASIDIMIDIKFCNGYYHYTLPNIYCDMIEFQTIIDNTFLPFDSVDAQSAIAFERAISLYQKDYLVETGYTWSLSQSAAYHKQFRDISLALARYYFLKNDYTTTKKVLNKILSNDNLDETIHELLLKVYVQENDYASFLTHYNSLKKVLLSELGTQPNNAILNLYNNFYTIADQNSKNKTAHF